MINNHTEYLDVEMCNMRWVEQINLISNKVGKLFYVFRELQNISDHTKLRSVYKAMAESILSYGIISWSVLFEKVYYILKINQNSLIRIALINDLSQHHRSVQIFLCTYS